MDFEQYKPKMQYPSRPKKPSLKNGATSEEARKYADDLDAWSIVHAEWMDLMADYRAEEAEGKERFWNDLFKHNGISRDHPKAAIFERIAWDKGHAYGFSEVWSVAEDLAELISD